MLTGPAGQLETLYLPPAPEVEVQGVAILAHPNPKLGGHNRHKVIYAAAKTLSLMGHHCYLPNYRGVGLSEGQYDAGPGETADVLACVAAARQRHSGHKLIVAGFSFGGHIALNVAQKTPVDALLLLAPSVALHEAGAPTAAQPERTTLIIAEDDTIDPIAVICAWAKPQNLAAIVIPGANHFFDGQLPLLQQAIKRWFRPH